MAKKGLTQANTLRSNNTTSTGYGIVYADEIIGSRSVKTKEDLNKLPDWVLGKDNKLEKGTTYYVENEKCFYIYTGDGWQKSFKSIGLPVKSWYAYDNDVTGTAATSQILDISKIIKSDDLYVGTLDGIEEQPHPFATIVVYNDEVNKVPIAYITLFESSDPDNPENNTVVASAKVFGVITKNVFPKTPDFNNINYYEGNCRPLDTGTQITNWRQTGGVYTMDKIWELNNISFIGNPIKTSDIDFTAATLQKFNNSISDTSHNICAQYSVVDVTHNNIVGQMLLIGDSLGHMVTEILTTSATLNNGVINWNEHSDTVVNTYIRRNHVKEGGTSGIAVGSWSTWTYYSGEGQYNDFKILVAGELSKKVNTSDVVQQTGDSTTSVMSQKAVTDTIQAEIDRATAAEKANAQAIAEEKVATQVKVEALNRKIDAQKNEVNAAKEEALQAISENEQSAITNFNAQRVTPEMLSESTKQLIEASGGGTITNLADDEDLTSVDDGTGSNVLKFADRIYNANNFSGKGYKILRKNIQEVTVSKYDLTITSGCTANGDITITVNSVENNISVTTDYSTPEQVASLIASSIDGSSLDGAVVSFSTQPTYNFNSTGVQGSVSDTSYTENRNVLTPNMIKKVNTIYEIRYDFDLNGARINIPSESVLRFNGGSINNGTIIFGANVEVIKPNFNCEQVGTFAEKNNIDFYSSIENFKKYNGARLGDIVYIGIQNRLIAYKIDYARNDVYNKTHGIEIEGTNLIALPFNGNNKRIFDVSAYGIVPDGTDMSDKLNMLIQQGITWEIASATLFFPAGTYVFKKPIIFKSRCGIMGELNSYRGTSKTGTVFDFSDIEFDDSDSERFCIKNSNGQIDSVKNIKFFSNSYSLVEDRWSLLTDNNIDNVWTETIVEENVNCIKTAYIVNECTFEGFSGTAIHGGFSHIHCIRFEQCNICISPVTDSTINNIFAYHCNTIINRPLAETLISDIRGDSIRKHAFDNCRNSTIFKNIMLDWYYQSPFNIIGSNSSLSSYGSSTIIIDQCCSRGVVNSSLKDQSNITDENTFDKIGYINCSNYGNLTTVNFANNIRIIGGKTYLNDTNKSYVIPNVGWSINANYDIIITGKVEITLWDIDIKDALSDYSIFRRFIEVLNGSVSGKVYLNNEPFKLIKLSKGKYNKDTIKYIGNNLISDNGSTEERPNSISSGFQYFDTTLKKPIWWTGTEWVDSNGVSV